MADATAAAQSSYGQLRKDGLRSWAQQNAELIRKYVTLSVASIDSRARTGGAWKGLKMRRKASKSIRNALKNNEKVDEDFMKLDET